MNRGIVLTVLFLLALLGGIGGYLGLHAAIRFPGPLDNPKIVNILANSGTRGIAQQLVDEGAVDHKYLFLAGALIMKPNGPLMAGEYQISPRASVSDIVALLQSGKTYQRALTLAEGLTSKEIVDLVNAADALDGDMITTLPAEGSLLPETYHYSRGDTRQSLINRMQKNMTDTLAKLWAGRNPDIPVSTPQEAVTLASVVEKETGVQSERPRVAGVFSNRLRLGMPLQSDPTVIYAVTMGKFKLDRPIYRKDLEIQSPYNSYKNTGLPPGPIANPGKASLEAVLHPETHKELYFVADGTGGHAFAATLEDHLRNVDKWRAIERAQKQ